MNDLKYLEETWSRFMLYYRENLTAEDRKWVEPVASPDDLLTAAHDVQNRYSSKSVAKLLDRVDPLVTQLRDFSRVINTFVQAKPEVGALVWGPLALIIELAARHNSLLEVTTRNFEILKGALPRFNDYIEVLDESDVRGRFSEALADVYIELIKYYEHTVRSLRAGPFRTLLSATRSGLEANKRLISIKEKTKRVDIEANFFMIRAHGRSLKQLLAPRGSWPLSPELPYHVLRPVRNNDFRYRSHALEKLEACLGPGTESRNLQIMGLHGPGGVGKTQIATEFAHRHACQYDAILWLNAGSEAKLKQSIRDHASNLEQCQSSYDEPDSSILHRICQWLRSTRVSGRPLRWLMVFDNVDGVELVLNTLRSLTVGSVIITTRSPETARWFGQAIKVPIFSSVESQGFMLSVREECRGPKSSELDAVRKISDRLGYLPLVLDQIASYARRTGISYASFVQHYPDFDTNLLFRDESPHLLYKSSVRTTWTMTLNLISTEARHMMEAIAFFDHDDIYLELLESRDIAKKLDNGPSKKFPNLEACLQVGSVDRQTTDQSIVALRESSLVSCHPGENRLSCHRIIKEAVLQSIPRERFILMFDWAVFSLNACFPPYVGTPLFEHWDKCFAFYPHLTVLIGVYKRFLAILRPPVLLCEIMRRCCWYFKERGYCNRGMKMVNQAIKILQRAVEEKDHPGYLPRYICRLISELYATFGSLEYEMNKAGHGREWYEKSIAHRSTLIDSRLAANSDIHNIAVMKGNVSLTHMAEGDAEPGIKAYHHLIETYDTCAARNLWADNLAIAYRIHGNMGESLSWCRQANEWTKKQDGDNSLSMAKCHFNMGNTYLALGKDGDALVVFEECLRIRKEKAPTHAHTGYAYHKVGTIYLKKGFAPTAATFFYYAIDILKDCESQTGATARSRYALAKALRKSGSLAEAIAVERELELDLKNLGQGTLSHFHLEVALDEDYFEQFVNFSHR